MKQREEEKKELNVGKTQINKNHEHLSKDNIGESVYERLYKQRVKKTIQKKEEEEKKEKKSHIKKDLYRHIMSNKYFKEKSKSSWRKCF